MRVKLGTANAGMPSAGAKYDSTSQATTKINGETMVSREMPVEARLAIFVKVHR